MSPPENKVIVQRLMEEGWNQRNFVVVEEIVGPEHVFHEPWRIFCRALRSRRCSRGCFVKAQKSELKSRLQIPPVWRSIRRVL